VLLTKTKAEMVKVVANEDGCQALFGAVDEIRAWRDHLKASLELAEAAEARVLTAAATAVHEEASHG
jgi:hypothetical protein